jgi:hypothetical protein
MDGQRQTLHQSILRRESYLVRMKICSLHALAPTMSVRVSEVAMSARLALIRARLSHSPCLLLLNHLTANQELELGQNVGTVIWVLSTVPKLFVFNLDGIVVAYAELRLIEPLDQLNLTNRLKLWCVAI